MGYKLQSMGPRGGAHAKKGLCAINHDSHGVCRAS